MNHGLTVKMGMQMVNPNCTGSMFFKFPGRCSSWLKSNCTGGDSGTEPYLVAHYQLLAHAAVVNLYKTKYQVSQKGVIGIPLVINYFVPLSDNKLDIKAAERATDFMFGW